MNEDESGALLDPGGIVGFGAPEDRHEVVYETCQCPPRAPSWRDHFRVVVAYGTVGSCQECGLPAPPSEAELARDERQSIIMDGIRQAFSVLKWRSPAVGYERENEENEQREQL